MDCQLLIQVEPDTESAALADFQLNESLIIVVKNIVCSKINIAAKATKKVGNRCILLNCSSDDLSKIRESKHRLSNLEPNLGGYKCKLNVTILCDESDEESTDDESDDMSSVSSHATTDSSEAKEIPSLMEEEIRPNADSKVYKYNAVEKKLLDLHFKSSVARKLAYLHVNGILDAFNELDSKCKTALKLLKEHEQISVLCEIEQVCRQGKVTNMGACIFGVIKRVESRSAGNRGRPNEMVPGNSSVVGKHNPRPRRDKSRDVIISGLPPDCNRQDIYKLLSNIKIKKLYIPKSVKFARVTFDTAEGVVAALERDGEFIRGCGPVKISLNTSRPNSGAASAGPPGAGGDAGLADAAGYRGNHPLQQQQQQKMAPPRPPPPQVYAGAGGDNSSRPAPMAAAVCPYYLKGNCKYGSSCRKSHASNTDTGTSRAALNINLNSARGSGAPGVGRGRRQQQAQSPEPVDLKAGVMSALLQFAPDLVQCSRCNTNTHNLTNCPKLKETELHQSCGVQYHIKGVQVKISELEKKHSVKATLKLQEISSAASFKNCGELEIRGSHENVSSFKTDVGKLIKCVDQPVTFTLIHVGAAKLFGKSGEGGGWLRSQQRITDHCYVFSEILQLQSAAPQPATATSPPTTSKRKQAASLLYRLMPGGGGKGKDAQSSTPSTIKFGTITLTCSTGDIAKQTADLLVNSTSSDFQLACGNISQHLLSVGGPGLQTDCDAVPIVQPDQSQHPDLKVKLVPNTGSSPLLYKEIAHLAGLAQWAGAPGSSEVQSLGAAILFILREADARGYRSVVLPPIGTGNLGYPADVFCECLCDQLETLAATSGGTTVTSVKLIVNEDTKAQSVQQSIMQRLQGVVQNVTSAAMAMASTSKSSSSDVSLVAKVEDITVSAAQHHVVVTSKGITRKVVLKAAGSAVDAELNTNTSMLPGGFNSDSLVVTSSGNLPCKGIYHLNCSDYDGPQGQGEVDVGVSISKCLDAAHSSGYQSIAFPAIGTGQLRFPVDVVASIFCTEVNNYRRKHAGAIVVKQVTVVSVDQRVVNILQQVFNATGAGASVGAASSTQAQSAPPKVSRRAKVTSDFTMYTVRFTVWALQGGAGNAKRDILDYCNKHLLHLTEPYPQGIGDDLPEDKVLHVPTKLQCNIKLTIDYHNCCIHLEGHKDDAQNARHELLRIFHRVERAQSVAESKAQWKYEASPGNWGNFSVWSNLMLEEAHEKKCSKLDLRDKQSNVHSVSLDTCTAVTNVGNQTINIRRCDVKNVDLPNTWTQMTKPCQLVLLATSSHEYNDVKNKFLASAGGNHNVIQIERVQNPRLYKQYRIQAEHVEQRCKGSGYVASGGVERQLYHGTSPDSIHSINERGFDRGFAGKNGVSFGNGVYFATSAKYSVGYATGSGPKHIYVCQVVTGEYCQGDSSMKVPPQVPNAATAHRYDTTVDNMSSPGIYVAYNDSAAYPQYLITFT